MDVREPAAKPTLYAASTNENSSTGPSVPWLPFREGG